MALAVAGVLGRLGRDSEKVCPMWSSVGCSSPGSSWAGKTEAKTLLEEGNLASASPSSWEWGSGSCIPVRDTLRCGEISGLLEGILVSLASLSPDFRMGSWVDLGEAVDSSSKERL